MVVWYMELGMELIHRIGIWADGFRSLCFVAIFHVMVIQQTFLYWLSMA